MRFMEPEEIQREVDGLPPQIPIFTKEPAPVEPNHNGCSAVLGAINNLALAVINAVLLALLIRAC